LPGRGKIREDFSAGRSA